MELQQLFELGPYQVLYCPGEGRDLALSFASVGHDPQRHPSPEFVATATGRGLKAAPRSALFIQDNSRSWAADPCFPAVLDRALSMVAPVAPFSRRVAIGMSMGGFSALVASRLQTLDAVLAFVPQWSIDPKIMPEETRWQQWRGHVAGSAWPTCPLPVPAPVPGGAQGGRAYLFHAGLDDMAHMRSFPQQSNCDHILYPDCGHSDLVPMLKGKGVLAGLLEAAFADDRRRLLRIATGAGGKRVKALG